MEDKKITMKEALGRQLYFFRFCLKASPGHFLIHVLGSIKVEAFIFLEHTWWIGYNLRAVEEGMPFSKLAVSTLLIFILFIFHQLTDAVYNQWSSVKLKPLLYQKLREEIYEKARQMDLACYDNPAFYNEFILSTTEADRCVDRFLEDVYTFFRRMTGAVIFFLFLCGNSGEGLLIAGAGLAITLLSGKLYYALQARLRLEINPAERRRAYSHRVFYLLDYAKELRLHERVKDLLLKDFYECSRDIRQTSMKYGRRLWLLGFLKDFIAGEFLVYGVYAAWLLWKMTVEKRVSVSEMVILFYAVRSLSSCCSQLAGMYPKMRLNSVFIEKIRKFLEYRPQIKSGSIPVKDAWESLRLSHVDFSYSQGGGQVLKDINMEIRRGQKIALVGYNGAGKSTLIKLIMRLYDPDSGEITRNSEDIRSLDLAGYRSQIGAVFQDYKIYAASLRENVVMDLCAMDKKETYEVEKSLYDARFTLTDRKLKYQTETPLTTEFEKDGVNLSGGESQKVAIARALYRKNDLIIMDEPSSALDPMAEYQLNKALREIAADKTVVFISHRLSTTRDADCIYMMEDGRIVEQGTHSQLLAGNGKYAQMWNAQAGRYC